MNILLTNDDGVDAPGLVPLARSLEQLGHVSVVLPGTAWVGKAITRLPVASRDLPGGIDHALSAPGVVARIHALGLPTPTWSCRESTSTTTEPGPDVLRHGRRLVGVDLR